MEQNHVLVLKQDHAQSFELGHLKLYKGRNINLLIKRKKKMETYFHLWCELYYICSACSIKLSQPKSRISLHCTIIKHKFRTHEIYRTKRRYVPGELQKEAIVKESCLLSVS